MTVGDQRKPGRGVRIFDLDRENVFSRSGQKLSNNLRRETTTRVRKNTRGGVYNTRASGAPCSDRQRYNPAVFISSRSPVT